jgi:hypothetical protein
MDGILGVVLGQLGGGGLGALGGLLGTDNSQTQSVVSTAVNVITGAMAQNTSEPAGAQALDAALEKDHDGGIFEDVMGFIGNAAAGPGAGILGHVLGGSQPQVQQGIADKTGLSMDKVLPLLIMVAPLVLGALGKMKKDQAMDSEAVAATLAAERQQAEQQDDGILGSILGLLGGAAQPEPQQQSSGGGLLGALGGLFGKKKSN